LAELISVIICSRDDHKWERVSAMYRGVLPDAEQIRIADARSLSEGYNRGMWQATGDYLVFSHDDVEVLNGDSFAARVSEHLDRFDVIGVAGTTRVVHPGWTIAGVGHVHGRIATPGAGGSFGVFFYSREREPVGEIQALDGVWLAAKREVARQLQFDARTFDGWHLYDVDFSFRSHLAGFQVGVCPDLNLLHFSGGNYDDAWEVYARRFLGKHAGRFMFVNAQPARVAEHEVVVATKDEARRLLRDWPAVAGPV
jgi:GT2 family glycosyltransferase